LDASGSLGRAHYCVSVYESAQGYHIGSPRVQEAPVPRAWTGSSSPPRDGVFVLKSSRSEKTSQGRDARSQAATLPSNFTP